MSASKGTNDSPDELYRDVQKSVLQLYGEPDFEPPLDPDPEGYVDMGNSLAAFNKYIQDWNKPMTLAPTKSSNPQTVTLNLYISAFRGIKTKYSPLMILIFMLVLTLVSVDKTRGVNPIVKHLARNCSHGDKRGHAKLEESFKSRFDGGGRSTNQEPNGCSRVARPRELKAIADELFEQILLASSGGAGGSP